MKGQLDLFGAEALRCLREAHDALGSAHGELFDRYEALWVESRTLRAERDALQVEIGRHLRNLDQAQRQAECWKAACEFKRMVRTVTATPPTLEPILKQLLTLAHPDKWSQGQPATELAHELAIAINATREHMEVQP
jgi:hypothetical protein